MPLENEPLTHEEILLGLQTGLIKAQTSLITLSSVRDALTAPDYPKDFPPDLPSSLDITTMPTIEEKIAGLQRISGVVSKIETDSLQIAQIQADRISYAIQVTTQLKRLEDKPNKSNLDFRMMKMLQDEQNLLLHNLNPLSVTDETKEALEDHPPILAVISSNKFNAKDFFDNLEPDLQPHLQRFLESTDFEYALSKAGYFLRRIYDPEDYFKFRGNFYGYMVEMISYYHTQKALSDRFDRDTRVLHPRQSFDLYSRLYPNNEIITDFGLNCGIMGITVPDGLVINKNLGKKAKQTRVLGSCEYMAADPDRGFSDSKLAQIKFLNESKEKLVSELKTVFDRFSSRPNHFATAYLHTEFPDFPKNYHLAEAKDFRVFFTILRDTPNPPGARSDDVFRLPFIGRSLKSALDVILQQVKQISDEGHDVHPRLFLP